MPCAAAAAAAEQAERRWAGLAALLVAHAALGLLMHKVSAFATLHAVVTLLAALTVALSAARSVRVLQAAAYITASEVMWRMCGFGLLHETAKLALCVIFALALLRLREATIPKSVLAFLACLLPAAVTPFVSLPFDAFRKACTFNLSGPIALAVAVWFCANARISARELVRTIPVFSMPMAGVTAITLFTTYSQEAIRFTTESNFSTSGGFGPNQVSSALGLGALLLVFYAIFQPAGVARRAFVVACAVSFMLQSAMTFSRNGVIAAGAAFAIVSPWMLCLRRRRPAVLITCLALAAAGGLAFSKLNDFTGGKLATRFSERQLSGRGELVRIDLELWRSAPVFGVGVGLSRFAHFGLLPAHTEFSRLVAEHGAFGLVAVIALLSMAARPVWSGPRELASVRPVLVALAAWTILYSCVNAMRTAAPAFALGMATLGSARRRAGAAVR